jgi:nicotinate-nucleotide pyrophosphorylase (carboxylating)
MIKEELVKSIIKLALEEDIATGDITTNSIVPMHSVAVAALSMKAEGVISGLEAAHMVFSEIDRETVWTSYVNDGDKVRKGDVIAKVRGSYRALLSGERTALNILQRMSGIATETARYVSALEGTGTKILDTRKTAPGMRVLDKKAVMDGGGTNHRSGLYDMVLIKDNHIKVAGGITNAVNQVKSSVPKDIKIEVEVTNMDEVAEAVNCEADIIMLDNMNNGQMEEAVKFIAGRAKTEASGNMSLERVKEVAATGVDFISVGALTHTVKALDISMNITQEQAE